MKPAHLTHRRKNAALDADVTEDLPHHVTKEKEVNGGGDGAKNNKGHLVGENPNRKVKETKSFVKKTYRHLTSKSTDPDRVERISQLNASLTDVKKKERNAAGDDGQQVTPVYFQRILFARFLDQHMLASKDKPEGAEHCVEDSLPDVRQQQHETHFNEQSEVFEWHWGKKREKSFFVKETRQINGNYGKLCKKNF